MPAASVRPTDFPHPFDPASAPAGRRGSAGLRFHAKCDGKQCSGKGAGLFRGGGLRAAPGCGMVQLKSGNTARSPPSFVLPASLGGARPAPLLSPFLLPGHPGSLYLPGARCVV